MAVVAGAVSVPIGATIAIDSSCDRPWFAFGLYVAATYAFFIVGAAAFAGDRVGGSEFVERIRVRGVWVLVALGLAGAVGWIGALIRIVPCQ